MCILGIFLNNEMRTGANRRYLELMESLAEKGETVFVIMNSFLKYESSHFTKISLSIPYRRKSFPPASYLFKKEIKNSWKYIEEELGDKKPQLIHIHGDTHLSAALFCKQKLKAKLFYASRCNDILRARLLRESGNLRGLERFFSHFYEEINRRREKKIAQKADIITFQNTSDRDDFIFRTHYPLAKTCIISGNIGLPRCTDEWKNANQESQCRNLIYVGVLSETKGLQYLLKAVSILTKFHPSIKLTVLGKTNGAGKIFELVKELKIQDNVIFAGYASPFSHLCSSSLMVFPTVYDAFPDTILEALHTGCPVIATKIGGIPDILHDERLLFDAGNVAQMVEMVEKMITDSVYYCEIRKLCAEQAERFRFDWAESFRTAMKE